GPGWNRKRSQWLLARRQSRCSMREREDRPMASLCNQGKKWFIVHYRNKKRQPLIYLGDVSESFRKTVLRNVEELVSAKISGAPVAQSTAKWLAGIDPTLRKKLAN